MSEKLETEIKLEKLGSLGGKNKRPSYRYERLAQSYARL